MLSTVKKNLDYLKFRLGNFLNSKLIIYRNDETNVASVFNFLNEPEDDTTSINREAKNMSQQKNIIIFSLKAFVIFLLFFFFIILPIKTAFNKAVEKFNKNNLVKIISLDFIDNPLTFIRLAEHYYESGKMDRVKLYIEYADSLMAKANYPVELKQRLEKIRKKLMTSKPLEATEK